MLLNRGSVNRASGDWYSGVLLLRVGVKLETGEGEIFRESVLGLLASPDARQRLVMSGRKARTGRKRCGNIVLGALFFGTEVLISGGFHGPLLFTHFCCVYFVFVL